jgi:NuA3 HAT complex component NTO1
MFKKDILLIFENARIYNAKDTIFYKFADILQTFAQPLMDKLKETKKDVENSVFSVINPSVLKNQQNVLFEHFSLNV